MGADSSAAWLCKGDVVADLIRDDRFEDYKVLAKKSVRAGLWVVWEARAGLCGRVRFIEFNKIEHCGRDYWVKSMCESEGPYYYDCPKKFLELVPLVRSAKWRDRVEEFWARKAGFRGFWLNRNAARIDGYDRDDIDSPSGDY